MKICFVIDIFDWGRFYPCWVLPEFIFVFDSLCLFNWFWVLVKLNQNRMWDLVSFQSQNHWGQIENTTGRNHSLVLWNCPVVTDRYWKSIKMFQFDSKNSKYILVQQKEIQTQMENFSNLQKYLIFRWGYQTRWISGTRIWILWSKFQKWPRLE